MTWARMGLARAPPERRGPARARPERQPLREKQFPSYAGKVFLDVGMNVGVYSLVAASYGMKVVGFEAMPQT